MEQHISSYREMPLMLTVTEVGSILRIGRNTTYQLVRCGKIRSLKIGRQVRVPRQAILDFLAGSD